MSTQENETLRGIGTLGLSARDKQPISEYDPYNDDGWYPGKQQAPPADPVDVLIFEGDASIYVAPGMRAHEDNLAKRPARAQRLYLQAWKLLKLQGSDADSLKVGICASRFQACFNTYKQWISQKVSWAKSTSLQAGTLEAQAAIAEKISVGYESLTLDEKAKLRAKVTELRTEAEKHFDQARKYRQSAERHRRGHRKPHRDNDMRPVDMAYELEQQAKEVEAWAQRNSEMPEVLLKMATGLHEQASQFRDHGNQKTHFDGSADDRVAAMLEERTREGRSIAVSLEKACTQQSLNENERLELRMKAKEWLAEAARLRDQSTQCNASVNLISEESRNLRRMARTIMPHPALEAVNVSHQTHNPNQKRRTN